MNDFILSLKDWKSTERTLDEVQWRIDMFFNGLPYETQYNKEWEHYNRFWKWFKQKKNTITYRDRLCEFDRTQEAKVYGIAQGYVCSKKKIKELKDNGSVKIGFDEAYDIRQRGSKVFKGCFMEIVKV
jgi:hypothetical protein